MDIAKLFKWKTAYTILGASGTPVLDDTGVEITVYIRVIGDNDLDEAKKYALRESKKLRTQYREHPEDILPDVDSLTQSELAALVVLNEASYLYKQAERDTTIPYPNSMDSLHIEDEEVFLEKLDSYFEDLVAAIDEKAQKLFTDRKTYYETLSLDVLQARAKNTYIDRLIEADLVKLYNDAILYYAIYYDEACTEKVFKDIPEVRNSSKVLKEQLYTEYSKLVLTDTDLKK
jgi:hypothetical protein